MVAVPARSADSLPLLFTETTELLELDQLTSEGALNRPNLMLSPTSIV